MNQRLVKKMQKILSDIDSFIDHVVKIKKPTHVDNEYLSFFVEELEDKRLQLVHIIDDLQKKFDLS